MNEYDVVIKTSAAIPTRAEAVDAAILSAISGILTNHTKAEAIAQLDYIMRVLAGADKRIRELILPEIKDCAGADAYDHFTISAQKAKAKWVYPDTDNHLIALRLSLEAAKKDLTEYEKELIKTGKAIDENENNLTVMLRERKQNNQTKGE